MCGRAHVATVFCSQLAAVSDSATGQRRHCATAQPRAPERWVLTEPKCEEARIIPVRARLRRAASLGHRVTELQVETREGYRRRHMHKEAGIVTRQRRYQTSEDRESTLV